MRSFKIAGRFSRGWWSNRTDRDQHSVVDLKALLEDVLNNPRLAAHVLKNHELTVNAIHESADTSGKRKRRRMNLPEPALEHPEVTALQRKLDAVKLNAWPYLLNSAAFLRGPRSTDLNPFTEPVRKWLRSAALRLSVSAEARSPFSSETLIIPEHGYCIIERPGCVDCNSVSQTAVQTDRSGAELTTCCIIFSNTWRSRELHTMRIKRNARGGLRG